ncbi:MAG: carboxypeptidase-like regulatory domain-containing protein [Candidatus Wallbacteria bacterium]|nr:carboxypeptidase-like regulatory domain-containing protein [Candidatus Wallbacteria bacterium]
MERVSLKKRILLFSLLAFFLSLLIGCGGDGGARGSRLVVYVQEAKPAGATIADATVRIYNGEKGTTDNNGIFSRQLTKANGPGDAYIFEGLSNSEYSIIVEKYGYQNPTNSENNQNTTSSAAPLRANQIEVTKTIQVEDGQQYVVTVYLEKTPLNNTGVVQGKVREKTADGSLGDPIANVTVSIVNGASSGGTATSAGIGYTDVTTASGDYTITDIPVTGQPIDVYAYPPSPMWKEFKGKLVVSGSGQPTIYDIQLDKVSGDTGTSVETGTLTYSLALYSNGPTHSGNNPLPGTTHKIYYDMDKGKSGVAFVVEAQSDVTGVKYFAKYEGTTNAYFKFPKLPAGSYTLRTIPDLSANANQISAQVVAGRDNGYSEERQLADAYAGHLRVWVAAGNTVPSCTIVVRYLAKDVFSVEDDNITIPAGGGSQGPYLYDPLPWATYTSNDVATASMEVTAGENVVINALNTTADSWVVVKMKS